MSAEVAATYRLAGTVDVGAPVDEVRRWLVEPQLLERWVIGVQSVTPTSPTEVRVTSGSGRMNFTLLGVILELTPTRVVKRYVLDSPRPADQLAFDRTVRFDVAAAPAGTRVSASVDVIINGLPRSVVGRSEAVEQRALERSLERLRSSVAGRRRSLWAKWRDQGQSPQVL